MCIYTYIKYPYMMWRELLWGAATGVGAIVDLLEGLENGESWELDDLWGLG